MMTMDNSSSLTIPVPSIITSSPGGGRFDFDDGGTYCGGWQEGKAHGHGVCTGPKNQGEYSGSWNFGFEMSGVYRWKNGGVYEGRWQNGKRHGVGVEYNGKWIYKGEWSQGYKGRYGVKASSNSAVKYEGTWANGLQDGYGSETYSDGGFYQGQMCRGLRHGYGVRKSAPYGDSQLNNPNKNGQVTSSTGLSSSMLIHSNSLQSGSSVDLDDPESPKPEDGFKPHIERTLASKNGFILVAKPLDVPMSASISKFSGDNHSSNSKSRRNSLTNKIASSRIPGSNQTASLLRGLRLKKQKSTSDLDNLNGLPGGRQTPGGRTSATGGGSSNPDTPIVPFSLSPEELDITDPTTVETYTGEWKHDKRNGHGVCERSDGLKYEGQWHNDMKCGYGVTTFKDGTKEEGKYKNNILIVDSKVKRFFQIGSANIRQRIDEAVKMAHQTQTMALKKAEIADTRAATARDKHDQATTAALEADRDSQIAYAVARQYSESNQLGLAANANALYPPMNPLVGGGFNFANQNNNQLQHSQPISMDPGLANLGLPDNSLGRRRISQHQQQQQQQQQLNRFAPHYGQGEGVDQLARAEQNQNVDPNVSLQQQQSQQYLATGPVEPFNGRRGSFRGGASQQSSGYQSMGFQHGIQQRNNNGTNFGAQLAPSGGGASGPGPVYNQMLMSATRQPSDPFNDLFDHYKSTPTSHQSHFPLSRKQMHRQTSLDYNKMRASVPRQIGSSSFHDQQAASGSEMNTNSRSTNSKLFRMSSMDHAEENQSQQVEFNQQQAPSITQDQQQSNTNKQNDNNNNNNSNNENIQQQFKHLVTSGEDLQRQQQQQQQATVGKNAELANSTTGSSYILPQSTNSSFFGNNQTPSPSDGGQSTSFRSQSSQFYDQQQQAMHQQHQHQQQQQQANAYQRSYPTSYQYSQASKHHRDVHSLADEQLYAAGRRLYGDQAHLLDQTDYSNYDFTISSSPPLSRRCMRRTASLSRNTPIKSTDQLPNQLGLAGNGVGGSTTLNASLAGSSRLIDGLNKHRSTSPGVNFADLQQVTEITLTGPPKSNPLDHLQNVDLAGGLANHQHQHHLKSDQTSNHLMTPENSSVATSAASSALNRKPSLQVRYDPVELGGLMTREEVAALSHAQREQRRLEAELAEERAKRPLFHLCKSLGGFISQQRLLLSFFILNLFLVKMFADLIAG